MMFRVCSDIHLEFPAAAGFELERLETDSETTLLLAGDIGCWAIQDGKLISFLKVCSQQFKYVLYVLGNHEYYGLEYSQGFVRAVGEVRKAGLNNVRVMNRSTFILHDEKVVVFGDTLWTDCNKDNPIVMRVVEQSLSDFVGAIRVEEKRFTTKQASRWFKEAVKWLRGEVDIVPSDFKKVLLTHHGISTFSIHPRYGISDLNWAFVSDLYEEIIELGFDLAVHGHVHDPFDYMIGEKCRVVAAPVGYPGEREGKYMDRRVTL